MLVLRTSQNLKRLHTHRRRRVGVGGKTHQLSLPVVLLRRQLLPLPAAGVSN